MTNSAPAKSPPHVPIALIYPFDLYALSYDPRLTDDTQKGLTFLHREAPDVFFTPHNGGHWTVTRYRLMCEVLTNPDRFSASRLGVPKAAQQAKLIPLTLDPPEHSPYRRILMHHFAPKVIAKMEEDIRRRATELIEAVRTKGACDFIDEVGMPLPVFVFMDLMGLPKFKFGLFRTIVVEWFATPNGPRRQELAGVIVGHLREVIAERRAEPRDDLVSSLIDASIDGKPLPQEDIESMSFLLFLAGLDTVANAAGFMLERLARMPELQPRLGAHPELIAPFIDEVLRMSGVVTTARVVTQDTELGGVQLREGDMVLCPLALAGLDEDANEAPLEFRMDRQMAAHLMFATGPHLCVGHFLARLELRVLLEEWLRAVPSFELDSTKPREIRIGSMTAVVQLGLRWQVPEVRPS